MDEGGGVPIWKEAPMSAEKIDAGIDLGLSDEEKDAEIAKTKKMMDKFCPK